MGWGWAQTSPHPSIEEAPEDEDAAGDAERRLPDIEIRRIASYLRAEPCTRKVWWD